MSFASFPGPVPLRRNRDFLVAVTARTTSLLGDYAALVALTLRAEHHGPWAVSTLLIAGFLPLLLLTPIAGGLADRIDSRTLLLAASAGQLVACVALASVRSTAAVLVLVFALGCGDAVAGATWTALLPAMVEDGQLGSAIGIRQAAATMAGIAAPALGGLLTGLAGTGLVLYLDAASFLAIGAAAMAVHTRRGLVEGRPPGRGSAGLTLIRRDRVLSRLIGALFAFCLIAGMANVVTVFLIRQTLHASATWFGVEGAMCAATMTLGSVVVGRVRGQRRLIVWGLAGMSGLSLACIGYGLAPTVLWLLVPAAGCGFANAALNVCTSTVLMTRSPEAMRGRVAAAVSGVTSAGQIGSMLLGGVLAAVLTPRQVFVLAGVGTIFVPIVLIRGLLREVDREAALITALILQAVPAAG